LKAQFKEWIAQGKTKKAIQHLLEVVKNIADEDLQKEAALHSSKYENFSQKKRTGAISIDEEKVFLAQINTHLLDFVDRLPEDIVNTGNVTAHNKNKVAPWQWLTIIGSVVAILAGMATFSGYTLKDLFPQQEEMTKEPQLDKEQAKEQTPPNAEPATTQSSKGTQSPNIKTESGDVNLNFGKLTKEEKETPASSKAAPVKTPGPAHLEGIHQSSEGDQSPNVITKDGNVDIQYDDWDTTKKDTSKNQ
jgi:hypothetical protein